MPFGDAVAECMADKSRRLRATTLAGYESAIRRHLLPRWAGRELGSYEAEAYWAGGKLWMRSRGQYDRSVMLRLV